MKKIYTLQTAFLFPVPTMHGWCEQNIICMMALGTAASASDDITIKAFTKTSTDGRNGTWASNEFSVSLQTRKFRTPPRDQRKKKKQKYDHWKKENAAIRKPTNKQKKMH